MIVYVDGSNRKSGIGGIGYVIFNNNNKLIEKKQKLIKYKGSAVTNNIAEYMAIIEGIKRLRKINKTKEDCILYSDSRVVVNQIINNWKINYPHLKKLNIMVQGLVKDLNFNLEIKEIRRDKNTLANDLAQGVTYEATN